MKKSIGYAMIIGLWVVAGCGTEPRNASTNRPLLAEEPSSAVGATVLPADVDSAGSSGGLSRGRRSQGGALETAAPAEIASGPVASPSPEVAAVETTDTPSTQAPAAEEPASETPSVQSAIEVSPTAEAAQGAVEVDLVADQPAEPEDDGDSPSRQEGPRGILGTAAPVLDRLLFESPSVAEATADVRALLNLVRAEIVDHSRGLVVEGIPAGRPVERNRGVSRYLFVATWGPTAAEENLPESPRVITGSLAAVESVTPTCAFDGAWLRPLVAEKSESDGDRISLSGDGRTIEWETSVGARADGFIALLVCERPAADANAVLTIAGQSVQTVMLADVGYHLLGDAPVIVRGEVPGSAVDVYSLTSAKSRTDNLDTGVAIDLVGNLGQVGEHTGGVWGGLWLNTKASDLTAGLAGGIWLLDEHAAPNAALGVYTGLMTPTAWQAACRATGGGVCDQGRERSVIGFFGGQPSADEQKPSSYIQVGLLFEEHPEYAGCSVPTGVVAGTFQVSPGVGAGLAISYLETFFNATDPRFATVVGTYCKWAAPAISWDSVRRQIQPIIESGLITAVSEVVRAFVPSAASSR
ncbi:MAG: hypothetical protein HYY13_08205 [Nitrospirae bacterium]|nr:hypothetical protein [Nitrospirota bacterium]